jgi:hypothetical protein
MERLHNLNDIIIAPPLTAKGVRAATEFYDTVVRASLGVVWETNRPRVRS